MKKTVFRSFPVLAIVFLLSSCDASPMDTEIGVVAPENEGLRYLTITYHSQGHTSGEVPVDGNRYVVPRTSNTIPPSAIVSPEQAIVMGPGTLKKDGFRFEGWAPRQRISAHHAGGWGGWVDPGELIDWGHIESESGVLMHVRQNVDFDAVWRPLSQ